MGRKLSKEELKVMGVIEPKTIIYKRLKEAFRVYHAHPDLEKLVQEIVKITRHYNTRTKHEATLKAISEMFNIIRTKFAYDERRPEYYPFTNLEGLEHDAAVYLIVPEGDK